MKYKMMIPYTVPLDEYDKYNQRRAQVGDTSQFTQKFAKGIEREIDVRTAISRLPAKLKEVIILRYYGFNGSEPLELEEIAAKLGTTVGAIKMRIKRAQEQIREYIEA